MPYFKESRSAINRRILAYLIDKKIIVSDFYTQEEKVDMYLNHKKLDLPSGADKSDFIVELFNSGDLYPEYKRKRRRKIGSAEYLDYLKSPEWRIKREQAIEYYGGKCSKCKDWRNIQVHHRTYKRLGFEMISDLQLLCRTCHMALHKMRKKRVNVELKPQKNVRKTPRFFTRTMEGHTSVHGGEPLRSGGKA